MQTLLSLLVAPFLLIGSLFAPHQAPAQPIVQPAQHTLGSPYDVYHVAATEQSLEVQAKENGVLGASNLIETPIALFHTSLANAITATANSMTLVSGTTLDGTSLASSTYSFVIDSGTPTQEFVIADCTGTVCTNMQRGLSVVTGTSTVTSLEQPHRRTASIDIVDAPLLLKLTSIFNGITGFQQPVTYIASVTNSVLQNGNPLALADVSYANFVGSSGCANALSSVRGCVQLSTALQQASSTQVGSTGANLVPWNAISTSTPTYSCDASGVAGALCSTIAQNDGKLSPSWLNGSGENYTFNGLTTLNGGTIVNASSTYTGMLNAAGGLTVNGSSLALKFGGTGALGALSISSGTTTINLNSAAYWEGDYTSISITGTGALAFSNPSPNGTFIALRATGNVTLTCGGDCINASALGSQGGISSALCSSGGTSATGGGTASTTNAFYLFQTNPGVGATSGGTAGAAGAAPTAIAPKSWILSSTASSTLMKYGGQFWIGAGGGGGNCLAGASNAIFPANNGGTGGGGVLVEVGGSLNMTASNAIYANGVAGANAATLGTPSNNCAAGGGGGAGGFILVIYNALTSMSGTLQASAGVGGNNSATTTCASGGLAGGGGGGNGYTAGVAGQNTPTQGAMSGGTGAIGATSTVQNTNFF